jgi:hypothetical protein
MAGATLGLMSILLPWVEVPTPVGEHLVYGLDNLAFVDQHAFAVFTATLLAGSCLAFLSTLGGALQLVGVAGFFYYSHEDLYGNSWTFEIGFYLAVLSAIIVCASTVVAIGPGWTPGLKVRNPFKIGWNDFLTAVFPENTPRLGIDSLCVAGACLGIYAMAVAPWTFEHPTPGQLIYQLDTDRNLFYYVVHQTMGYGPLLIAAGTFLLFASSLAVILLLCGEVLFMQAAAKATEAGDIEHIGGGFGIILIVTANTILSLVFSLLHGRSKRLTSLWWRFLTLGVKESAKV